MEFGRSPSFSSSPSKSLKNPRTRTRTRKIGWSRQLQTGSKTFISKPLCALCGSAANLQYLGTLRSISSDHAVMPPLTLFTALAALRKLKE